MSDWPEPGSRGFWLLTLAVFGGLELLLRIKLGSILTLIGFWSLIHQWLLVQLEPGRHDDLALRWLRTFYLSTGASAIIFAVFFALNAVARSIDESFRFFQLP